MSDARIHEMLAEPLEKDFGMPLTEVEQEILQAMVIGGAILPMYAERYRVLAARRRADGGDDELRAQALDAAGTLGAVLYDSLLLLTDPEFDEEADVTLTGDDLDVLLSIPEGQEYVNPQL